jgi:ABC-type multidrug transport system ATPase subunit
MALQGVELTAPDGRITGLLGPNGAGKTTTLRITAGSSSQTQARVGRRCGRRLEAEDLRWPGWAS